MHRQLPLLMLMLAPTLLVHTPQAAAATVSVWVTDTMASASVFTGSPEPVIKTQFDDTASSVDVLFAKAESFAEDAYATAFARADGSATGTLFYSTNASARADTELNGLATGNYRISFSYTVLSSDGNELAGSEAAVGYQYGGIVVELAGTDAGAYTADIALNDGTGPEDNWIAFFAWSSSHAVEGTGVGNATISDITVTALPGTPALVPLPSALWLFGPALGALAGSLRRGRSRLG